MISSSGKYTESKISPVTEKFTILPSPYNTNSFFSRKISPYVAKALGTITPIRATATIARMKINFNGFFYNSRI